jgi:hypothetical protein
VAAKNSQRILFISFQNRQQQQHTTITITITTKNKSPHHRISISTLHTLHKPHRNHGQRSESSLEAWAQRQRRWKRGQISAQIGTFFFFAFAKAPRLPPILLKKKKVTVFHVQCTNACIQNILAKSIKCKICFQDFQSTAKRPALEEHASNKHSKKYEDCFPAAA